jgi:cell division control protein 6
MATYLSELFKIGQARNLFIYGKPGTGKTICINYLLNEINKHASETKSNILTACVNAGKTRTPYYTMMEILKSLRVNVPAAGWQMFRLKQTFEQLLNTNSVLIAIDEVDGIIYKEKEPIVYYLNRQPKTTLILISNKIEDAMQLPERNTSTLQPRLLKIEPYTAEEANKILRERVEHAFKPNVITDKLLYTIATAASEAQDIRLGFHILLSAALLAEENGK